jgi:hypothetical protein
MTKQILISLLVLSLGSPLFTGCRPQREEVAPEAGQPGRFVIALAEMPAGASGRTGATQADTAFDLGPLKASRTVAFALSNGGDAPIFDVALTSDQLPFEITPRAIDRLPGTKEGATATALRMGIVHGLALDGSGRATLLPKGRHSATIHLTGKTIVNQDTLPVHGAFAVSVEAKVIDIRYFSGNEAVNPLRTGFYQVEPARTVRVVNAGNVAVTPSFQYYVVASDAGSRTMEKIMHTVELQPGASIDITGMIAFDGERVEGTRTLSTYGETYVDVAGDGTVSAVAGYSTLGRADVHQFSLLNKR